ncbi:hypothetical protein AK88_03747 [Plasmodium fragile]|uniref:Uncharacterized protein n=1 Tax=Plasmodium fragile TaxID=5857 RepID=A0A0D9QI78_PLAFR|nr:uncharacterized protein AK88_03747 [Plasmodium fragile]KJP86643.1 hypothetical protein AK88_03747 [Plasmodium fragile]
MTQQHPHGSSENVLERALLAINQSRISCVQKNAPFEETYLIKKKKYDHLLDLKFCHVRRGSSVADASTSAVEGEVGGGGDSPPCPHGNLVEILPTCNRKSGRGHSTAYFILRQWCEKLGQDDAAPRKGNLKRADNLSEQEGELNKARGPTCKRPHVPISYVIIGTHQHGQRNAPCSYEEMTVEIPNYDVERKIIKAEWFHKSDHVVSLLTYEQVDTSTLYSFKFKSVIRLINVEGKIKEEVKIVVPDMDVIRRKLKNENLEDIKKELYKMETINISLHLRDATSGQSGTEEMNKRSLPHQHHGNNLQRVQEASPNNDKVNYVQGQNDQDRHTNMGEGNTDGMDKKSPSNHPISNDLDVVSPRSKTDLASDHVLSKEEKKKLAKKNKYKNLVVDYCFGAPSENIPWIETCLFVLLKDGLILIYTPIITNEWYVSYFLMYELNRIGQRVVEKGGGTNGEPADVQRGDGEGRDEEYVEDFLTHYDHFRGVSVREYREKDVWVTFNRGVQHARGGATSRSRGDAQGSEGSVSGSVRGRRCRRYDRRARAAFSYVPYVVNCLRKSTYRSITMLYYNHLVFMVVTDKFGYVFFVLLNYFITPHIVIPTPGQSETDSGKTWKKTMNFLSMKKKKQSFFFNIFNLKDNAIFENLTSADLANLINRDKYDEYYRRVKNGSYEMASLMGKMSQRGTARECAHMEVAYTQGGEDDNGDGTVLRTDSPNDQHHKGENLGEIKIDSIKLTTPKTQKKSLFKERFTKKSNLNEKGKHKHSPGSAYTSDEDITERDDDFFSCYEDNKDIVEKQINEEVNLQLQPLSVLYFDAYYTGMSNVKTIVLNSHNMLCFNNDKVVHLHLVWVKFVSVIFYLIHLKNILCAKLIHEMCKNGLYMSNTVYKAAISFYQFDYYTYLLLDHTKRLNQGTFAGLFAGDNSATRDAAIQWEQGPDNFDRLQSKILYDVQYVLHPVVVQESSSSGSGRKSKSNSSISQGTHPSSDVYLIFTHYINLDSQRKEKLFMSGNISFFTSSLYKNLFLVYDCFKLKIISRPGNTNLNSEGTNETHLLLREKKKCKALCHIPGQARLRNFYINTEVVDDDSIDLNMYANMLSLYVNSRCNDYMNSMIKKNFIFYQGKGAICNMLLNRDARAKGAGSSMLRSGVHKMESTKMMTHMYSGNVGANSSPRLPYSSGSNHVGEHNTEEIDFLKHVFVILHSNENGDGKDIHIRNVTGEESGLAACKKYNFSFGSTIEQVNPEKLINDIKVHVLKGDSKKYDNVPCTTLIKKLIKVKNDYIHVKDYFLTKKKINLDSRPSDIKGKINFLEQVVHVYYFLLDLNFYYENKFEKIKKRIIHSLGVDIIHFIKSHASIQNMSKALIERNTSLVKDIQLCYQKHQLIRDKFNLLRKRILLHSLVNSERFTVKWAPMNEG